MIEEQRRRLAELKQKAAAEAQCQWDALHGAAPFPAGPSGFPQLLHHSILHHLPASRERGEEGEHAYDTLSLESSDSMETSISTGGNSACSPDTMSRYPRPGRHPTARRRPAHTRAAASTVCLLPLPPQCQRPGCGEDGRNGEDAERSPCGEEPAHGVEGEADLGHGRREEVRGPGAALCPPRASAPPQAPSPTLSSQQSLEEECFQSLCSSSGGRGGLAR